MLSSGSVVHRFHAFPLRQLLTSDNVERMPVLVLNQYFLYGSKSIIESLELSRT